LKKEAMKKFLLFFSVLCLGTITGQVFSPISTYSYNLDAVAENTTATSTTGGALDGSNYVLYSQAYGALYSVSNGLPNSGLITSGTRTYQLQSYTTTNVLYLLPSQTDSILFTSPAAYSGISILGFGTEGSPSIIATVRFTDNTTQVFSNLSYPDWFGSGNAIISGFDRASRTTGTPANASGNPKMFAIDLAISCPNRSKNIYSLKIQNVGSSGRSCVMAVSGAAMPIFSATSTPVTCSGGTDGAAVATGSGGIAPYTYTWSTQPAQNGSSAQNLPVGIYTVTAADAGSCATTVTVAITQSLVPQPSLNVVASNSVICEGASVTIGVAGAATYTWSTNSNSTAIVVAPIANTTYTVGGYTSSNCYRTGSINITVNAKPVITFNTTNSTCLNSPLISLTATPVGGSYFGTGVSSGSFNPSVAGLGTKTITYTYTDANNCTASKVSTIVVNAVPVLGFTLSSTPLCSNAAALTLTATPSGGTFAGTGVNGSVYTPSVAGVGTQTVSYTYTDANNCTAQVVSSVLINEIPTVTITTTKKFYCKTSSALFLNASPSGGVFSGPGIVNAAFNPSVAGVGTHQIIYTYTDVNNCSNSSSISMTVSACTGLEQYTNSNDELIIYPNPGKNYVTIKSARNTELVIVNELGQKIKSASLNYDNGYSCTIEDLSEGIYFVMSEGTAARKIIITR
jgi:hypothetical protein